MKIEYVVKSEYTVQRNGDLTPTMKKFEEGFPTQKLAEHAAKTRAIELHRDSAGNVQTMTAVNKWTVGIYKRETKDTELASIDGGDE